MKGQNIDLRGKVADVMEEVDLAVTLLRDTYGDSQARMVEQSIYQALCGLVETLYPGGTALARKGLP